MTKPKHAPLPLYAQKAFDDNGCITAPIFDANDKWMFSAYGSTKEEAEANASLIVKAVNNHHNKLVEMLKMCQALLDLSLTHMNIWDNPKGVNPELREALEKYSTQTKIAIKAAEGGEE